jgi:hypothetical protein
MNYEVYICGKKKELTQERASKSATKLQFSSGVSLLSEKAALVAWDEPPSGSGVWMSSSPSVLLGVTSRIGLKGEDVSASPWMPGIW